MKKIVIPKSYSEYIEQMHNAGYTSIDFIGNKTRLTTMSFRYSRWENGIEFTPLVIENYYGGLVYTHSNKFDTLLLIKDVKVDAMAINLFELQNNCLYKAIEGKK